MLINVLLIWWKSTLSYLSLFLLSLYMIDSQKIQLLLTALLRQVHSFNKMPVVVVVSLVTRSCLTLGISQPRILQWVAISFSRGSSQPRDWTHVSCLASRFFTPEPPGKPQQMLTTHLFCATHLLKIHNWNKTDKWSTFIKFIIWEGADHEYTQRQTM